MCILLNFFVFTHRLFWSLLLRSCLTRLIDWWSSSERKSFSNEAPMSFFLFWYSIIAHDRILKKEKSSLKHFFIIGAVGHQFVFSAMGSRPWRRRGENSSILRRAEPTYVHSKNYLITDSQFLSPYARTYIE